MNDENKTPPVGEEASKPAPKPEPAAEEPKGPELISIDDFARVDLRAGKVLEAGPHPDADRLLVMKVDTGEAEPRQIVAGIRKDWEPEQLVGRTIVVVANLKPAKLRGLTSQGMLLAVRGEEKVLPLGVDGPVAPGTRVS